MHTQKGFAALPLVFVLIVIVLCTGTYYARTHSPTSAESTISPSTTTTPETTSSSTMLGEATSKMKPGSYEVYAPEKLARAATGKVVLFFHANWCPTCRALDADIKAHMSQIPEKLSILDVDYDNSSALKQKYGVTYQHTLVQVDQNGTLITKWSASPTLADIVAHLK